LQRQVFEVSVSIAVAGEHEGYLGGATATCSSCTTEDREATSPAPGSLAVHFADVIFIRRYVSQFVLVPKREKGICKIKGSTYSSSSGTHDFP
jgi:hypothetical protein